jgi:hypothetical protein
MPGSAFRPRSKAGTNQGDSSTMKRTPLVTSLGLSLLVTVGACGDPTGDDIFEWSITGDVSFQAPHAGHIMTSAFVRTRGGLAFDPIGGGGSPISDLPETISFHVGSTVERGETFEFHYWIDSNFGGGTVGVCDSPQIDHQWKVVIPEVQGDVNTVLTHDPTTVTDVCSTF